MSSELKSSGRTLNLNMHASTLLLLTKVVISKRLCYLLILVENFIHKYHIFYSFTSTGCFEILAAAEERVLPYRLSSLVDLKERAEVVEGEMQRQYADMIRLQEA
jgi:hypothetical protein